MEYANAVAKNSKNPLVALSQIVSNTDMARYIESFGTESESISITNQPSSSKSETTITAYNDAIESHSKLSEIGNGITAYNTGNIYILINNFSEAINWYNKSIAENATMSCAYYNRGLALLLTGSKTKGCTDLSVAGEMGIPQAYDALKRFCEK